MWKNVSYVKSDYVIAEWLDEDWKKFRKTVHELRKQGYRKICYKGNNFKYYSEYYRKKGKKKIVTVTMQLM